MSNFWDLQWYDYVRLCSAALALGSLYISISRARDRWDSYTQRLRELLYVFNGLLFLVFEGNLEQIATNVRFGPRIIITFLLMLAALRAVQRKEGYLINEGLIE